MIKYSDEKANSIVTLLRYPDTVGKAIAIEL
jgi:hypothetical protein